MRGREERWGDRQEVWGIKEIWEIKENRAFWIISKGFWKIRDFLETSVTTEIREIKEKEATKTPVIA